MKIASVLLIITVLALGAASCGDDDDDITTTGLSGSHGPYLTSQAPFITLTDNAPSGSSVIAIINSGDELDDFTFSGIPDGIGIVPAEDGNVNVFVSHEESTVPFRNVADFQDSSISKLTLDTETGAVLGAEVVLPASEGYKRFCSGSVAGPNEGFSTYVYLANEESNDIVDVPAGASYSADPGLEPQRQAGYAVALNTDDNSYVPIAGLGRLNHENTIALPGYKQIVLLTTDDTFSAPSAQLYMYVADNEDDFWADRGSLWAFRATHDNDGALDAADPFNGANDYLDLSGGRELKGEFIEVPANIARGTTSEAPQTALENWSNENNVFQFIRLEDLAYDKNDPNVIYIADTGSSRVVPDPDTGRLLRGPDGTEGMADGGSVFRLVLDDDDPQLVTSLSVLATGDDSSASNYVEMRAPDNLDTSSNSLIVQEDSSDARIWMYSFDSNSWTVIATVNDSRGESSGVVDASEWFGEGSWLLDVQGSEYLSERAEGETTLKLSAGQLMLLKIPGS